MGKIRATIVIDEKTWKNFKKKAIDENKQYSQLLEEIIKKNLNCSRTKVRRI